VLPPKRGDFLNQGRLVVGDQGGGTGITYVLIPWYQRKFASILATNFTGALSWDIDIHGISFTTEYTGFFDPQVHDEPLLGAPVPVGAGVTATVPIKASVVGLFDYLLITFAGDVVPPDAVDTLMYKITCTDEEV
jgi:hypothetical protein